MAQVNKIITTGTGQAADWLTLSSGDHVLHFTWVGSPGDADLQLRPSSGTFRDAENSSGVVNITANRSVRVSGGCDYSVDVNTHTSVLYVEASKCD